MGGGGGGGGGHALPSEPISGPRCHKSVKSVCTGVAIFAKFQHIHTAFSGIANLVY